MCRCVLELILLLFKICHTFDLWVARSYPYLFLFLIRARKEAPLRDICHHCQNHKSKDTAFLPLLTPVENTLLKQCPSQTKLLTNQPSFTLSFFRSVLTSCIFSSSLCLPLSLNVLAGSLHLYWNQLHESSGIC